MAIILFVRGVIDVSLLLKDPEILNYNSHLKHYMLDYISKIYLLLCSSHLMVWSLISCIIVGLACLFYTLE